MIPPPPRSTLFPYTTLFRSNGVIVYQEQAMQIAKEIAGFSGAKADDLRKAIGKKNREAMATLKPEFFEGCRRSRSEEHTSELQSQFHLVCRLLLEKKKDKKI